MRFAFAPLSLMFRSAPLALALATAGLSGSALAAPKADIQALAQKHQQPLLDTLRDLVHIVSGSKDMEGDDRPVQPVRHRPVVAQHQAAGVHARYWPYALSWRGSRNAGCGGSPLAGHVPRSVG